MPSEAAMRAAKAIEEWTGDPWGEDERLYVAEIIDREMGVRPMSAEYTIVARLAARGTSFDSGMTDDEILKEALKSTNADMNADKH